MPSTPLPINIDEIREPIEVEVRILPDSVTIASYPADKPQSRLQRYRLTDKGKDCLK